MERVNFGYSVKNIPLPNERAYKLQLIVKIEAVIKRMRWKANFYDPKNATTESQRAKIETFGLKTAYCPKKVPELNLFENELIQLAENVKFRKTTSNFQKRMKKDLINLSFFLMNYI